MPGCSRACEGSIIFVALAPPSVFSCERGREGGGKKKRKKRKEKRREKEKKIEEREGKREAEEEKESRRENAVHMISLCTTARHLRIFSAVFFPSSPAPSLFACS